MPTYDDTHDDTSDYSDLDSVDETSPARPSRKWIKILAPLLVLIAGAFSAKALIDSRQPPPRQQQPSVGPLVEVMEVEAVDQVVLIEGEGEVNPSISVELLPEVSGKVVKVSPSLVAGGRFRAGEALVHIDPRDYELALQRARAAVARARVQLQREQAEAEAAVVEWRYINGDAKAPSLLAREPQVRQAEAELAAGEADLATAELALRRTRLSLPFDGVVITKNVAPGQLLGLGRAVATVYGTDEVEVRVPLADSEVAWLDLPKPGKRGPNARVSAELFGARRTWEGWVDRLEGQMDPRSRMVHVVVRIADPFEGEVPLLPGTFVDVAIDGKSLQQVYEIPRHALRQGDTAWVVRDGQLEIVPLEVARSDRQKAFISSGLGPGDQVVSSSLDVVTDGMVVRLVDSADNSGPSTEPQQEGES